MQAKTEQNVAGGVRMTCVPQKLKVQGLVGAPHVLGGTGPTGGAGVSGCAASGWAVGVSTLGPTDGSCNVSPIAFGSADSHA
jgi:hypothetical protein